MEQSAREQFAIATLDSRSCAEVLFQLAVTRFLHRDLVTITGSVTAHVLLPYKQVRGQLDGSPQLRRLAVAQNFLQLSRDLLDASHAGRGLAFMDKAIAELRRKRAEIRTRFHEVDCHNHETSRENQNWINGLIVTRTVGILGVSLCGLVAAAGAVAGTAAALAKAADATACYAITKMIDGTFVALNEASIASAAKQEITTAIGWLDFSNRPCFLPSTNVGVAADLGLAGLHGAAMKTFEEQLNNDLSRRCGEARDHLERRLTKDIQPMQPKPQFHPTGGGGRELNDRRLQKSTARHNKRLSDFRRDEAVIERQLKRQGTLSNARLAFSSLAIPIIFFGDDCASAFRYYHEADPDRDRHWKAPRPAAR
jgi:hypothetical protein